MKKTISSAFGVLTAIGLSAGVAHAQSLRPNILIIFDTSGSMLYNQNSDGSPLCGSDANGQTSRNFRLKNALRQALQQVGTDEANFGLMRFPQNELLNSVPVCPRLQTPAGTQFGHYTAGNGGGCRLSTDNAANNATTAEPAYAASWFDVAASQALLVPVTKAATGLKPTAGTDFDPLGGNISAVYRWIDETETPTAVASGPLDDPELRSPPNNSTPLGRSLFYARTYFDNFVKAKDASNNPLDPKAGCRTNLIILVTDGAEMCDQTAGTGLNLTNCAPTGTFATYHPRLQACKLNVNSGVKTYLVTDASLTTAEKTAANDIANAGGTGAAIFVTLTDTNAVKQAIVDIIAKTVPPAETCNGLDDNCNGLKDEGVSNMCPFDPVTLKHCAVESCNCKDDDCDGLVDEGFPPNACGQPCGCAVPPETCNGLDDNCDGDVDEGFGVGATCDNGLKGACHRTGIIACNAAGNGTVCDAPVIMASAELCDGIDNNCDGQTDEGPLPGVGVACGNGIGTCQAGVTVCMNGKITCTTSTMPTPEVCNGKDDNCDGVVDNGNFPETGMDCVCPGLDPAQIGVGPCKGGKMVCRGTRGFVCEGCVLPSAEICDGIDNNCDGTGDNNPICPSGFGCKEGSCTLACVAGEFPCPGGYKCVNDFCIPQRCAAVTCPTDTRCDEATGACVDVCTGVVCRDPKICQHGSCVDCYTLGCPGTQQCVAGRCQTDLCLGVTCAANQYCDSGNCVDLCTENKRTECAASNQRCVGGVCIADNCATIGCPDDQFCDQTTASCKNDVCRVKQCARGETCVKETGTCIANPCSQITCPSPCWTCTVTVDGQPSCTVSGDCQEVATKIGNKGGGGCGGCDISGDGMPSSAAMMLAAVSFVASWRRRRRSR